MKMKKVLFSLILFITTALPAFGQTKTDSLKRTETPMNFSAFFNPYNNFNDPYFFNELNKLSLNTYSIEDSSSIWMRTRMQMAGMSDGENINRGLQSPFLDALSRQYSASQNLKTLRSILGAVQVGAVGYLAYQHLKKYGFLKKK
jgi:hypothetical protein